MTRLTGFGISGFRSFDPTEPQFFRSLTNMNFIVGQNNAGKSNILRFIKRVLGGALPLEDLDYFGAAGALPVRLYLECPEERWRTVFDQPRVDTASLSLFVGSELDRFGDGSIWVPFEVAANGTPQLAEGLLREMSGELASRSVYQLSMILTGTSGGSHGDDLVRVLGHLGLLSNEVPAVEIIPAFRQVRDGTEGIGVGGEGIVGGLQRLASPRRDSQGDRILFEQMERFVQTVLEDDEVRIEIPHDAAELLLRRDGRLLPLSSMGTGIEQVVILAASATLRPDALLMMEEPEVFLHPRLQRQLVRYLATQTRNQYLIATHSAHMLNYPGGTVFHVRLEGGRTKAELAREPSDRSDLCDDLGYQASDLMQTNAVIWVEGPSDRLYIRHWLYLMDPTLVEHLDYSIMFFGGSLMSHLSGEFPHLDGDRLQEFISLRRLNRNMALVVDSDLTDPDAALSVTKQRLMDEIDLAGEVGHGWVTAGYTIENYVPIEILRDAIAEVHPSAEMTWDGDPHVNPLAALGVRTVLKTRIARSVCDRWADETAWDADLGSHIRSLAAFIRRANGK